MPETPAAPRPELTPSEAAKIALEHWDLPGRVRPLPSYIDANFRIDGSEQSYVLKILNASEPPEELDFQHQAMRWIDDRTPGVGPRIVATRSGHDAQTISVAGQPHLARMVTFLPGDLYANATPHPPALQNSLGEFLGRLDRTLEGFSHPAANRYLRWDLKHAGWIADHLHEIEHPEHRRLAQAHVVRFIQDIEPRLGELPTSVIHNDANDYNILVRERDGRRQIMGVIDFGDMVRSNTVFELAIACAYAIMHQHDILEAAAHVIHGYHGQRPLTALERAFLMPLAGIRLATSVIVSAQDAKNDPNNQAYIRISEQPAWRALEQLASVDPQLARATVEDACDEAGPTQRPRLQIRQARAKLAEDRRRRLGTAMSLSYREPLKIIRGSRQFLFDDEGRAFLDGVNNVCHVGHAHPRVTAALADQAARLNTNTRYLHHNIVEYARRLTALFPDPLRICFLVCTGSEANDLALRMAQAHTGRRGVVVVDGAYHGNLSSLIELSPYKCEGPGGSGLAPHVRKVPMPDPYRGIYRDGDGELGPRYAHHVETQMAALAEAGHPPAAFLCESILSCGGQIVPPDGYLTAAHRHARAAGAVCIADEVQVGFGRTGRHWWGFEMHSAVPDIVTMGKPIGDGHPLAAVVTTPEIAASFDNGMEYFNTFGGNPVSAAVGLAVLDVMESERLRDNATTVGDHLLTELRGLMDRHERIGDVRGVGLFLGVEFVRTRDGREPDAQAATAAVEAMRGRGVLLSTDGPDHNVIKIKPPMVFTTDDADRVVRGLDEVLAGA